MQDLRFGRPVKLKIELFTFISSIKTKLVVEILDIS